MLQYLLYIAMVLAVFLVAVVFAAGNPGVISVDFGFLKLELQKSLAFILFLGIGWLVGVLSAGFLLLRMLAERRQLRKALRLAETEVRSLRSMPLHDAD